MCQSTHGYGKKKKLHRPRKRVLMFSRCGDKRTGHVTFPTMCSNIPAKTTILPLGYHRNIKADNTKNVTNQGAKSQPQMNPGQFSLAAFTTFTVNILMSPLLAHCAKTSYKRKYKSLPKSQKKPFYILMQLTQMTTMIQQQH